MTSKNSFRCFCFALLALNSFLPIAEAHISSKKSSPIEVTKTVNSSVQKVWEVMMDFKHYGDWNQWVVRLEGEAEVGAVVHAFSKTGQHLDLKITSIDEERHESCWVDVSWFTAGHLLGGWRCRRVEAAADGRGVKFINHFEFTGPLGGLLDQSKRQELEEGMELENESLRAFVERK